MFVAVTGWGSFGVGLLAMMVAMIAPLVERRGRYSNREKDNEPFLVSDWRV